jgi:hypothetical protein
MKVKKLMLQLRIFTNDEIRVDAEMGHKYIDFIVLKGHFLKINIVMKLVKSYIWKHIEFVFSKMRLSIKEFIKE